ncbi:transcriptional regulator domain-containing protein [Sphingobium limneticum]|uniref:transcriptional regulator domain-containing protein n=1 Tax=Sphingobium limneticum TaxID=1007511 RepID=UPI003A42EE5F
MWEWLRRDPAYIAWHVQASTATRGVHPEPLAWGLHFRRTSEPRRARGPDHLACRI